MKIKISMKLNLVLSTIIALTTLQKNLCYCAKILAIFPIPFKSHFNSDNAITKSLKNAGHEITLVTSFPQLAAAENYSRVIDTTIDSSTFINSLSYDQDRRRSIIEIGTRIAYREKHFCNKILNLAEYQDFLNLQYTFDVVFMEIHFLHQCLLPIAQKLNVPVIGVITHKSWYYADRAINNVNHPANVPFEFITEWKFNKFYQRLINVWNYIIAEYFWQAYVEPISKKFYEENEDMLKPYSEYQDIEPAIIFYNGHHSFLPRPMNPNVIEIGGIQIPPAKALPEFIRNFIEEAKHGVVLFTFGSMVKVSTLPLDIVTLFKNVFTHIPQRVIWKFEEEMDDVPSNVMLAKWLPQRDILEHPNVKVFMSHCGQGGVYEAIHTATPVIALPLCVDQPGNAAILEHLGVAVQLNVDSLSEKSILEAINAIVNDTKYFNNMQKLSKVFHDRPTTPEQTVVYWTEYVIRHNGAPNLKPPSSRLNWFQYFLLDVICFVTISFFCIVYFIYRCVKIMVTLCRIAFFTKNKLD